MFKKIKEVWNSFTEKKERVKRFSCGCTVVLRGESNYKFILCQEHWKEVFSGMDNAAAKVLRGLIDGDKTVVEK